MKDKIEKIAVVAGNGPSLSNIDYSLLPELDQLDIFRCNQFYFEEKYFLGKDVKYAFYNPSLFFEQYYTSKQLISNNEYDIENIVCSTLGFCDTDRYSKENFDKIFVDCIYGYDIFKNLKDFNSFFRYNEIYNDRRITSGIYMCAIAIALGYKKIYIAGIDFYIGDKDYAFNSKSSNLLKKKPEFSQELSKSYLHSINYDIEALLFLQKKYDIKFYSVCPNSPINQYIPLATRLHLGFPILPKPENFINDLFIPSPVAYGKIDILNRVSKEAPPKPNPSFLQKAKNYIKRLLKSFLTTNK
ncbi:alpha-2,3-sialyltransferase [Riemerella columbipharyngis]|uniref:Alpha-2,3 sialyltransferase n=1 Tax=Riemerella columbipharyngis TaxID=1071918 RepID=A0A1G6YJA6_9FLAO|nr:alpha-2,3-sialyltransferase [Riemerella columbipharyngis]SDD90430.1 alpha-2,3 sialyltransferase [Riemerella columbipharyngis]